MELSIKRDIVYALRKKGIAEPEIGRLVANATELQQHAGGRFSVADFVASIPRGVDVSKGTIIGRIAAAFLLFSIAIHLAVVGVFGVHLGLPGLLLYYVGVLLGLAALVISAYYVDRKLPDS